MSTTLIARSPSLNGTWFIECAQKSDIDSLEAIHSGVLGRPILMAKTLF